MKFTPKYFKDNLPAKKNARSSFIVRNFYRPLSFYLSSAAYMCGLTANRVSFIGTLIAYAAAICFLLGTKCAYGVGVFCTFMWIVLDCVDGNLARCVAKQPYGEFIDAVGSYTLVGILFPAVAFAAYSGCSIYFNGSPYILVMGAFASIADTMTRLYYQKYNNERLACGEGDTKDDAEMGRMARIYERLAKEVGISGLMIPFLLAATIWDFLDVFVVFYFLFHGANYIAAFAVLLKKSKCLNK